MSQKTAIVKWYNNVKGYGFLEPTGGGPDIFVHKTALDAAGLSTLREGQNVSYNEGTDRGKVKAVDLKLI